MWNPKDRFILYYAVSYPGNGYSKASGGMLKTLRIENFVIVDYQEIDFAPGFNVVTGETGAGKSLLINAFSFLLGARPREEWIRRESDFARVEGWFDISFSPFLQERLREEGWNEEIKGEMVLSREVNTRGRSQARINGRSVTLTTLKEVASHLDIYFSGKNHLPFISSFHPSSLNLSCKKGEKEMSNHPSTRAKSLSLLIHSSRGRAPKRKEKALIRRDLPAPVSPVTTLKPGAKSIS